MMNYCGRISKWLLLTVLATTLAAGCAGPKMSFVVDAPAKYDRKAPATMEVKRFGGSNLFYAAALSRVIANGVASENHIKVLTDGAETVLTGSLIVGDFNSDSSMEEKTCTRYRNGQAIEYICYTYHYRKYVDMRADYTLFDKETNSVIIGDSIYYSYDETFSSDDNYSGAASRAPSNDWIINDGIDYLAYEIVADVSPHKMTVERELATGGDGDVKLGLTYLENGQTSQALDTWSQIVKYSNKPKAVAASNYNLGVIKESQGQFQEALEVYRKANSIVPDKKLYMEAITRVEAAERQKRKFQEQTEKEPEVVPKKKQKKR